MTKIERQKWERIRTKGHARFIFRSFWRWGVWMCIVQLIAPFLFDAVRHEPFSLFPIFPWPFVNFVFYVVIWVFGFGYMMGEGIWQYKEKDYKKDDHVA